MALDPLAKLDRATFHETNLRRALDGLAAVAQQDGARGERVLEVLAAIADMVGTGANPRGHNIADWIADLEEDVAYQQLMEQGM